MTNDQQITKERVTVALDIAKGSHDAAIQLVSGKRMNIKIPNTQDGYRTLIERCVDWPNFLDTFQPQNEAASKASGLTPPRWLWRRCLL